MKIKRRCSALAIKLKRDNKYAVKDVVLRQQLSWNTMIIAPKRPHAASVIKPERDDNYAEKASCHISN